MKWDEQRDRMLAKAAEDEKAMAVLAADATTADAVVGFHAQQAVEKYLKALLSHFQVNYDRTHDLVVLLDALADCGHSPPPAVRFRYDDVPTRDPKRLDRLHVQNDVGGVRRWVIDTIGGTAP